MWRRSCLVPASVPEVMRQTGILSLEIQRMPKDPKKEFFHPADARISVW
jgi:4-alpha-glucanotransferase